MSHGDAPAPCSHSTPQACDPRASRMIQASGAALALHRVSAVRASLSPPATGYSRAPSQSPPRNPHQLQTTWTKSRTRTHALLSTRRRRWMRRTMRRTTGRSPRKNATAPAHGSQWKRPAHLAERTFSLGRLPEASPARACACPRYYLPSRPPCLLRSPAQRRGTPRLPVHQQRQSP